LPHDPSHSDPSFDADDVMITAVAHRLWLLIGAQGTVTLTGLSESETATGARTEHWPAYPLCDHAEQLPARLEELGLTLAPGAQLSDLDHRWDVYVRHTNPVALRAQLEDQSSH
jgi:hypothetical protein